MFLVALAIAAGVGTPQFVLGSDVDPRAAEVAQRSWVDSDAALVAAMQHPTTHRLTRVDIRRSFALDRHHAASSQPGSIALRAGALNEAALRHEVAHQVLFSACPQASRDALFHEAFATFSSGEAALWIDDVYMPVTQAAAILRAGDVDAPAARRAIARVLAESTQLPSSLKRALMRCADDAPWVPLTVESFIAHDDIGVDALVVLHIASGEVLATAGATTAPLPFGSTLKPFVVAGAADVPPQFANRRSDPARRCGDAESLDFREALRLSCNDWFLQWSQHAPQVHAFGAWGPVLLALGLSRLPTNMAEAIGLTSALTLSARDLANAYRLLALSDHEALAALTSRGTLRDAPGTDALGDAAAKTGTVRDEQSRAQLGWLVAVSASLVVVRARSGVAGRDLAADVAADLARYTRPQDAIARVQTFGLVDPHLVQVRCDGLGFLLGRSPRALDGSMDVEVATRIGTLACVNGAFAATVADAPHERPYAGVFRWRCPPPTRAAAGVSERQRRAREGSCVVFETRAARYTTGVLAAEDANITGAARVALGQVIAHNLTHADERHGGRPVCDTTHCQVFLGTAPNARDDDSLLFTPALLSRGAWHAFSAGGTDAWSITRPRAGLSTQLGRFSRLYVDGIDLVAIVDDAGSDVTQRVSCERLRALMVLPACPTQVSWTSVDITVRGVGRGHGLGLDVTRAKSEAATGATALEILRDAYGSKR